jgi:MoaA/NifB/PqqE/SkfB family radical SAM enzyme
VPHIQLETVTTCNAKCGFCPHPDLARSYSTMDMDLYRKIIDEVQTLPLIQFIYFVGLGETLLDPHLLERVRYIRSRGMTNTIGMFTNGFLATPTRIDDLYAAGVNIIHFSLNATSPQGHEAAMGVNGLYEKVARSAWYALTTYGPSRAQVCAVPSKYLDQAAFKALWGPFSQIWREDNFAGDTVVDTPPLERCDFPQSQINVLWDGRVTTCCMDPTGHRVFGDLKHQTIREVFNSEDFTNFRYNHSIGRGKAESPCDVCSRIR